MRLIAILSQFALILNYPTGEPAIEVKLTAPKSAGVLGESVVVQVHVKNIGKEAIAAVKPTVDDSMIGSEIQFLLSRDGQTFENIQSGEGIAQRGAGRIELLRPDETWVFEVWLLRTRSHASHLVFETAGKYFIKASYPLQLADRRTYFESNVVEVTIGEPKAYADQRIWQFINNKPYLYFLQYGNLDQGPDRIASGALDWLRLFPDSAYAPTLRRALEKYVKGARADIPSEKRRLVDVLRLPANNVPKRDDDKEQDKEKANEEARILEEQDEKAKNAPTQDQCVLSRDSASPVYSIAFSSDSKYVATGSRNGRARVSSIDANADLLDDRVRVPSNPPVRSLFFLSGDKRVFASTDNGLTGWHLKTLRPVETPSSRYLSSRLMAPISDSPLVVVASLQWLRLVDRTNGERIKEIEAHDADILTFAVSPDSEIVASTAHDGFVKLWDRRKLKVLRTLAGHTDWVFCIAFSRDSSTVATASYDGTARVWNVETGELIRSIKHSDGVLTAAISPDGKTLATGGYDSNLRQWDISTGTLKERIDQGGWWIETVAYSPDGNLIACGNSDGTFNVWRIRE